MVCLVFRHGDGSFPTHAYGSESKGDVEYVLLRVVSFQCSMDQSTLQPGQAWVFSFRDVLLSLGKQGSKDFVFCSGVGDARQGPGSAEILNMVKNETPYSCCRTDGEDLSVWNIQRDAASWIDGGCWSPFCKQFSDITE